MTEVSIRLNGDPRPTTIVFADENSDFGFVNIGRDKLNPDSDEKAYDAVDLTQIARDNFLAHSRIQQIYAKSVEDIATHITAKSDCEVAGFVLMKCDWLPDSEVIGICHFRRTWCNSIVLDYLAAYPFAKEKPQELRGVGSALLWFVSDIARRLNCPRIWGEATRGSRTYYEDAFKLKDVEDMIVALPENYKACAEKELVWRGEGEPNTMKTASVEELFDAEAANPPLIGNRSLMVSPSRTLAYHFVELQSQFQRQIARKFGLLKEGDPDLKNDYLFRELFRQATASGKLGDLWEEVETRHPWAADPNASFSRTLRFTHLYVRRNGKWLLAALHNSVPVSPAPSK
jgi:hypothetical protein